MKTLLSDDFYVALQKVPHVHQQRAEREARFIGRQRHQQINVTGIICVAPRHRPEHTYVGNSVAFSEGENPGAVLFDYCVHCTVSLLAVLPALDEQCTLMVAIPGGSLRADRQLLSLLAFHPDLWTFFSRKDFAHDLRSFPCGLPQQFDLVRGQIPGRGRVGQHLLEFSRRRSGSSRLVPTPSRLFRVVDFSHFLHLSWAPHEGFRV